jgi:hypothetical protein
MRNIGEIAQGLLNKPTFLRLRYPSMWVAVHLAEILGVSLDYLVLGREQIAPAPEFGYLTGHLQAHIRDAHVQAAALYDLTAHLGAEVGAKVADLIRSAAEELASAGVGLAGTLSPAEVVSLERCDTRTTIVTSDLESEILVLASDEGEDAAAPSTFARVLVENIAEGSHYEYIVPDTTSLRRAALLLRQELIRLTGLGSSAVDRSLLVRHIPRGCVPGFVVHHLSLERVERRAPNLTKRVKRFVSPDPKDEKIGFVATVTPASPSNQHFSLIAKENVPQILAEADALRQEAK